MAIEAAQRHGASTTPDLRKIGGRAGEARAQLDRELAENLRPLTTEASAIGVQLSALESSKAELSASIAEAGDEADSRIVRMRRAAAGVLSLGIVALAVVAASLADTESAMRLLLPGIAAMCLAGLVGGIVGVVLIRLRSLRVLVGATVAGVAAIAMAVLTARLAGADAADAATRGVAAFLSACATATVWWLSLRGDGPRLVDKLKVELNRVTAEAMRLKARRAEVAAEIDGANARNRTLVWELRGVVERAMATFIETVVELQEKRSDLAKVEADLTLEADALLARLSDPAPL